MRSIKEIFVIGNGPSSSHTMGPSFAVDYILNKYKDIKHVKVTLYGSLALTGKGHLTDYIIDKKLGEISHDIIFNYKETNIEHPNTIDFEVTLINETKHNERIYSIGGGSIKVKDDTSINKEVEPYKEHTLEEIMNVCKATNITLYNYVILNEGKEILDYIKEVKRVMEEATTRGLNKVGILPGKLKVKRKAKELYEKASSNKFGLNNELLTMASAYAVAEENASGGIVVTAPTCGSSGVLPGIISYLKLNNIDDEAIIRGLVVAGLIGQIIKTNASVSGAMCGCQAEIGVATSMGSALIMEATNYGDKKIAQAAEVSLEHSLGLTCDPIEGYVQIPCIERNAIFAVKAINSAALCSVISQDTFKISFDDMVKTMYETGLDIQKGYKETSEKGMSKITKFNN